MNKMLLSAMIIATLNIVAKDDTSDVCSQFATILKGKTLPMDLTGGVCTVAKPRKVSVSIDGIKTASPLVGTALFSFEKSGNKYLNLGETGGVSKEIPPLRDALEKSGINITAIHTHWLQSDPADLMYMHWMSTDQDPIAFAQNTIKAWESVIKD